MRCASRTVLPNRVDAGRASIDFAKCYEVVKLPSPDAGVALSWDSLAAMRRSTGLDQPARAWTGCVWLRLWRISASRLSVLMLPITPTTVHIYYRPFMSAQVGPAEIRPRP